MLDGANMAVTQPLAELDQGETLVPIILRRFLLGPDIGKELNAELHGASSSMRRGAANFAAAKRAQTLRILSRRVLRE